MARSASGSCDVVHGDRGCVSACFVGGRIEFCELSARFGCVLMPTLPPLGHVLAPVLVELDGKCFGQRPQKLVGRRTFKRLGQAR